MVQKYSSFVSFPIEIDGELANTTGAVWAQDPREVDEKTYESFYRATFKGAWDSPTYTLHFRADAPLDIKCVLFMPSFHTEKGGLGRLLEPSVGIVLEKSIAAIENAHVAISRPSGAASSRASSTARTYLYLFRGKSPRTSGYSLKYKTWWSGSCYDTYKTRLKRIGIPT